MPRLIDINKDGAAYVVGSTKDSLLNPVIGIERKINFPPVALGAAPPEAVNLCHLWLGSLDPTFTHGAIRLHLNVKSLTGEISRHTGVFNYDSTISPVINQLLCYQVSEGNYSNNITLAFRPYQNGLDIWARLWNVWTLDSSGNVLSKGEVSYTIDEMTEPEIWSITEQSYMSVSNSYTHLLNRFSPEFNYYPATELDTGQKWVDGKPIYRIIFSGTISGDIGSFQSTHLTSGIDSIVDAGGYWCDGNGSKQLLNSSGSMFTATTTNVLYSSTSGDLHLETSTNSERINAPYAIWAEYTKL
jgi:hypothetical protein